MTTEPIEVEVAYARPDKQLILKVQGRAGLTIREAIEKSGIVDHFPEIDPEQAKVGVFSKAAKLDTELRAGDRVEIYRPLIADPKAARKKKASAQAKPGVAKAEKAPETQTG